MLGKYVRLKNIHSGVWQLGGYMSVCVMILSLIELGCTLNVIRRNLGQKCLNKFVWIKRVYSSFCLRNQLGLGGSSQLDRGRLTWLWIRLCN
jgi:hypothetical protein